jgi:DNA-binding CsgD family transcriptional regulator
MSQMSDTVVAHEPDLHRALVDALPDTIAVISRRARIVFVNRAWTQFSHDNGNPSLVGVRVGDNYLSACEGATDDTAMFAERARSGISDVLCGAVDRFELEYPCNSPSEERWFRMQVLPIPGVPEFSALIHREITEYDRLREVLRKHKTLHEISSGRSGIGSAELAPRQRQVLELLARGFSNREIALTMGITSKTVDYHIKALKTKLGRQRRGELVRAGTARDLM